MMMRGSANGPLSLTLLIALLLLGCPNRAAAMDNGLVRTPPLGWMSWMYYTTDVSEEIIKGVADELVEGGYKDAGAACTLQSASLALAPQPLPSPNLPNLLCCYCLQVTTTYASTTDGAHTATRKPSS